MDFRTTTDTMLSTSQRIDQVNAEVQSELQRLKNTVEMVAGSWKGDAQVAFQGLMLRWNDSATKLQQSLGSISENISDNARAFAQAEADSASTFNI